ncbi:MAG: cytidine deaminase [Spirochaetia bacterium]
MNEIKLHEIAIETAFNAYAPYSAFRVGAALLTEDGTVYTGVNVENRSFGLTVCAERNAIFAAITDSKKNFTALALHCPDADYPVPPCGACRQVISEFVGPEFPVYYSGKDKKMKKTSAGELLPLDSLHDLKTD